MRRLVFLFVCLCCLAGAKAIAGTETFQQGVGGYTGCQDAYVETNAKTTSKNTTNFGTQPILSVRKERWSTT